MNFAAIVHLLNYIFALESVAVVVGSGLDLGWKGWFASWQAVVLQLFPRAHSFIHLFARSCTYCRCIACLSVNCISIGENVHLLYAKNNRRTQTIFMLTSLHKLQKFDNANYRQFSAKYTETCIHILSHPQKLYEPYLFCMISQFRNAASVSNDCIRSCYRLAGE